MTTTNELAALAARNPDQFAQRLRRAAGKISAGMSEAGTAVRAVPDTSRDVLDKALDALSAHTGKGRE